MVLSKLLRRSRAHTPPGGKLTPFRGLSQAGREVPRSFALPFARGGHAHSIAPAIDARGFRVHFGARGSTDRHSGPPDPAIKGQRRPHPARPQARTPARAQTIATSAPPPAPGTQLPACSSRHAAPGMGPRMRRRHPAPWRVPPSVRLRHPGPARAPQRAPPSPGPGTPSRHGPGHALPSPGPGTLPPRHAPPQARGPQARAPGQSASEERPRPSRCGRRCHKRSHCCTSHLEGGLTAPHPLVQPAPICPRRAHTPEQLAALPPPRSLRPAHSRFTRAQPRSRGSHAPSPARPHAPPATRLTAHDARDGRAPEQPPARGTPRRSTAKQAPGAVAPAPRGAQAHRRAARPVHGPTPKLTEERAFRLYRPNTHHCHPRAASSRPPNRRRAPGQSHVHATPRSALRFPRFFAFGRTAPPLVPERLLRSPASGF